MSQPKLVKIGLASYARLSDGTTHNFNERPLVVTTERKLSTAADPAFLFTPLLYSTPDSTIPRD
jgi:hypothetical protein